MTRKNLQNLIKTIEKSGRKDGNKQKSSFSNSALEDYAVLTDFDKASDLAENYFGEWWVLTPEGEEVHGWENRTSSEVQSPTWKMPLGDFLRYMTDEVSRYEASISSKQSMKKADVDMNNLKEDDEIVVRGFDEDVSFSDAHKALARKVESTLRERGMLDDGAVVIMPDEEESWGMVEGDVDTYRTLAYEIYFWIENALGEATYNGGAQTDFEVINEPNDDLDGLLKFKNIKISVTPIDADSIPPWIKVYKGSSIKSADIDVTETGFDESGDSFDKEYYGDTSRGRLRDTYTDFGEFIRYDDIYNISESLGFANATEAWGANPYYESSTDPTDLQVVEAPEDYHRMETKADVRKLIATLWGGSFALILSMYPNGRWGFAGDVPTELSWKNKDGTPLTEEQGAQISRSVTPGMLADSVTFGSSQEALQAAQELGIDSDDIDILQSDLEGDTENKTVGKYGAYEIYVYESQEDWEESNGSGYMEVMDYFTAVDEAEMHLEDDASLFGVRIFDDSGTLIEEFPRGGVNKQSTKVSDRKKLCDIIRISEDYQTGTTFGREDATNEYESIGTTSGAPESVRPGDFIYNAWDLYGNSEDDPSEDFIAGYQAGWDEYMEDAVIDIPVLTDDVKELSSLELDEFLSDMDDDNNFDRYGEGKEIKILSNVIIELEKTTSNSKKE